MNVFCQTNQPCPIILNSKCVIYEGANLVYSGINTNDSLETALEKIDFKIGNVNAGAWGFIQGNIYNQLDLINLLATKADIGDGLITPVSVLVVGSTVVVTALSGADITWKIGTTITTVPSPRILPITPASANFFRKDWLLLTLSGLEILQGIQNQTIGTLPNIPANKVGLSPIDVYGGIINASPPTPPVDIAAPEWTPYGVSYGKYPSGTPVPANASVVGQTIEAHTIILPPTYLAPLATLTSTATTSGLEVGQPLTIPLTLSFNQRNGGAETAREIRKNGVVLDATTDTVVISTTPISYLGNISYLEGGVLNNILGTPDPTGRITAGNVNSGVISYVGIYPYFYLKSNSAITAASMAAAIESGVAIQVTASSGGTLNIPYAPNGEYLAVAYPATSQTKQRWFVTELSQGNIGAGGVFGAPVTQAVDSKTKLSGVSIWTNINYKIHVSPLLTNQGAAIIQLRNS